MILLKSGEVLTLCGTYAGDICRARLALVPQKQGDRIIGGRFYRKIEVETYGPIEGCQRVLDLPGEEHYLVDMSLIEQIFPAKSAFRNMNAAEGSLCLALADELYNHCGIDREIHGAGGSSALGCRLTTSDFDWIIYAPAKADSVQRFLAQSPDFFPCWTFSGDYMLKKYEGITTLTPDDLVELFERKKNDLKYFRYKQRLFSLDYVALDFLADRFLEEHRSGKVETVIGTLTDGEAGRITPKVLTIQLPSGIRQSVLSWLFLYTGAFSTGDLLEVRGEVGRIRDQPFLFVDRKQHFIKLVKPHPTTRNS